MDQMFDEIVVNFDNNLTEKLCQNLKQLTEKLRTDDNRLVLNADAKYWSVLALIADNICHQIDEQNEELLKNGLFFQLITELFRVLRNSLVNCPKSKHSIVANGSLLDCICHVFTFLINGHRDKRLVNAGDGLTSRQLLTQSIKCCLQVLANLLSGSDGCPQELLLITDKIWKLLSFDLFRVLLNFEDKEVSVISSMIFYSCLRNNCSHIDNNLFDSTQSEELYKMFAIFELLLNQIESESSEWSLWSIQLILQFKKFLNHFYSHFKDNHKLLLLDIIHDLVNETENKSNAKSNRLNDSNMDYLIDLFKQSIGDIVKIDSQPEDSSSDHNYFIANHVSKLLSILCELTTNEEYLSRLQTDRNLMECLIDTLKTIQLIGKTGDSSHFKAISQLKEINKNDTLAQTPVFGFKRDIIRTIANLVYKCGPMQDWCRELDGIPLILDCCNIDAKNPYIMQWSIYAIRNVVEGNAHNQRLISRLSANGILIDDQLTERLGFKNGFNQSKDQ